MYIVRFIRVDGYPNEEYLYHNETEAMYHFSLFDGDDSGLYFLIEVTKICESKEVQFAKMNLKY